MSTLVFGVHPAKPLKDFPAGRVRLVVRNDAFARAYVKTADGIREFRVAEHEGYWIAVYEQGANTRVNT